MTYHFADINVESTQWKAYLLVGKLPGFLGVCKLYCRLREGICKVNYFLSDSIIVWGLGVQLATCFGNLNKDKFFSKFSLISLMMVLVSRGRSWLERWWVAARSWRTRVDLVGPHFPLMLVTMVRCNFRCYWLSSSPWASGTLFVGLFVTLIIKLWTNVSIIWLAVEN